MEEETYRMLVPDIITIKLLGRNTIGQNLRKKNNKMKEGIRFRKFWERSKVTGFTFNEVEAAEAEW